MREDVPASYSHPDCGENHYLSHTDRLRGEQIHLELLTQEPEAPLRATPLLFVHGAWCWAEHFLPYFAQHGYVSHALDLRGHGKSDGMNRLRWTSLANYGADVEQVIRQLEQPPVLIGHSMGGLIVQKYLETHQSPAAVLLASVPIRGTRRYLLRLAAHHLLIFLKVNTTLTKTNHTRL